MRIAEGVVSDPILAQHALTRRGTGRSIPWALRTPWTPLLLTVESILIDIVSAQLHD